MASTTKATSKTKKKGASTPAKQPAKASTPQLPKITLVDEYQKERALGVFHEMIRTLIININAQEAAALASFKDALRDPVLVPYMKDADKKIGELFTNKEIYEELAKDKRVLKIMETQHLADLIDEIARDEGRHCGRALKMYKAFDPKARIGTLQMYIEHFVAETRKDWESHGNGYKRLAQMQRMESNCDEVALDSFRYIMDVYYALSEKKDKELAEAVKEFYDDVDETERKHVCADKIMIGLYKQNDPTLPEPEEVESVEGAIAMDTSRQALATYWFAKVITVAHPLRDLPLPVDLSLIMCDDE